MVYMPTRGHSLACGQCLVGVDARAPAGAKTPAIPGPSPTPQPARASRLFVRSVILLAPQRSANKAESHLCTAYFPLLSPSHLLLLGKPERKRSPRDVPCHTPERNSFCVICR